MIRRRRKKNAKSSSNKHYYKWLVLVGLVFVAAASCLTIIPGGFTTTTTSSSQAGSAIAATFSEYLRSVRLSMQTQRIFTNETSTGTGNHSLLPLDPSDPSKIRLADAKALQETDERAVRWKKYKSAYNYQAPQQQQTSECGSSPDFDSFFQQTQWVRSRFNEDKIVYEKFFKGKLNGKGTYVELGAFDGSMESNTRFYDVCLGWKGLLIEGNPNTYQKTIAARPRAHRMSFAPSCQAEDTAQFYRYPMANSGLEGKAKTYEGKPTVEVPCGPLGPVLEDVFQGETINFFSLDVEGAEPMVLETIDFNKVRIDVLMVEVQNTYCQADCESRDQSRTIMAKAGYKRYLSGDLVQASDVYVHPDSPYYEE